MIGQLRLKPAEMLAPLSQVGQGTREMQFSSTRPYVIIVYSFIKLCIGTADVIHHFMICYWAICQPRFLVSKYVGCWSDCSTFIAYHCPMSWMSSTFLLLTFWSSNVFCRFQFQMGTLFKPKNMPPCDQKWVVFWMQNLCSEWDRWLGFFWPRPMKHQSHKRGKLDWGDGA